MTMYPEADYSLYKFARTRHGFWFWFIHGMVFVFVGVLPFTDQFHWAVLPIMALVEVGYWIGTNVHRNRLRKMNEKGPGSPHYDGVCEKCNPVRMEDGSPIPHASWWYAATRDVTREDAVKYLATCPIWQLNQLLRDYEQYLKRKEFDKFRK